VESLTVELGERRYPITIGPGLLLTFFGEMQQDWSAAMAASILAALPAVVVFGTLQRYFVQGLTTGAIKS